MTINKQDSNPWQWYLSYLAYSLKTEIQNNLKDKKTSIMNKNSSNFLQYILSIDNKEGLNDYLLLLKQIRSNVKNKDFNVQNYRNIYQASKVLSNDSRIIAVCQTENDQIIKIILKSTDSLKLEHLKEYGNNPITQSQINHFKSVQQRLYDIQ